MPAGCAYDAAAKAVRGWPANRVRVLAGLAGDGAANAVRGWPAVTGSDAGRSSLRRGSEDGGW
ncbi:hypothetical protein GCM10023224_50340 [Streptomonospora halophila]|uniref:Uncharacterized protein n=1 Tax=Streptomonospora halophila TaxID=427369 RepID=A0ABP9H0K2_9ACTN